MLEVFFQGITVLTLAALLIGTLGIIFFAIFFRESYGTRRLIHPEEFIYKVCQQIERQTCFGRHRDYVFDLTTLFLNAFNDPEFKKYKIQEYWNRHGCLPKSFYINKMDYENAFLCLGWEIFDFATNLDPKTTPVPRVQRNVDVSLTYKGLPDSEFEEIRF